jgi:hypothetical protein
MQALKTGKTGEQNVTLKWSVDWIRRKWIRIYLLNI